MHVSVRSHALEEYQRTGILEHETEFVFASKNEPFDCDLHIKTEYGENIISYIFIVNELDDLPRKLQTMRNGILNDSVGRSSNDEYHYAQVDCGDDMMLHIVYTDRRLILIAGYEDPYKHNLTTKLIYTRQEDCLAIIEALIDYGKTIRNFMDRHFPPQD